MDVGQSGPDVPCQLQFRRRTFGIPVPNARSNSVVVCGLVGTGPWVEGWGAPARLFRSGQGVFTLPDVTPPPLAMPLVSHLAHSPPPTTPPFRVEQRHHPLGVLLHLWSCAVCGGARGVQPHQGLPHSRVDAAAHNCCVSVSEVDVCRPIKLSALASFVLGAINEMAATCNVPAFCMHPPPLRLEAFMHCEAM